MVVLGKFLLFRPGGMKVLCMDVDVNTLRNIQDRMVHTEKEAREMAEPEDQVGSGDGKQGVIWRDQRLSCVFPGFLWYGRSNCSVELEPNYR